MDPRWSDPSAPVPDRVADLLGRLTLREKVAQLYGVWLDGDSTGDVAPRPHREAAPIDWSELVASGIGQLTRPYGTAPVSPVDGATRLTALQGQIIAGGRFGIPALVHEECLTGLATWQATAYPSPLCWAATFDPDLIERMGARLGRTMRRLGVHQGLAPVLDVVRDLRWGRVEETMGEDPYHVGVIGSAYVRGLTSAGIVATLKHFVGYSSSRAARNHAPVSLGPRELADVLLPPFEMALRAGAGSVMNSYSAIDGMPVAADPTLLTGLLRDRLGFTGTVVSDYFSIAFIADAHGVAADRAEAAALALAAGIDVELPSADCYGGPLLEAIGSGAVDVALVDRAVTRVLTQKCELGLLDPTFTAVPSGPFTVDGPEERALALEVARRSLVLLHNPDHTLPLVPGARLAVIGPNADEPGAMLGCYSFPRHVGVHHPGLPLGVRIPSVLDALRADPAGFTVEYAPGCPPLGGTDADIEAAVRTAQDADVCLVVLGDLAGLFGVGTSGEGNDASDLRLPGRQEELLDALVDAGTPVVLVLLTGRPYELSRQIDRLAAVLCGFFPGEEGGTAIAEVLAGRVNPSGRLPVSFPGAGANQPSTYLEPRPGRRTAVSGIDPTALFPFGHGLSYAPATWGDVRLRGPWSTDGTVRVEVDLRNDTDRRTAEVVQVYLTDPVAEVARPVLQLIAAPRVDLEPGRAVTVCLDLHADLLSYTGRAGVRQVDPGPVELRVGASSTDLRAVLPITVDGPRRTVGSDREMYPTVIFE